MASPYFNYEWNIPNETDSSHTHLNPVPGWALRINVFPSIEIKISIWPLVFMGQDNNVRLLANQVWF